MKWAIRSFLLEGGDKTSGVQLLDTCSGILEQLLKTKLPMALSRQAHRKNRAGPTKRISSFVLAGMKWFRVSGLGFRVWAVVHRAGLGAT